MMTSPLRYRIDHPDAARERLIALPSRTATLPAGSVEHLDQGEGPAVLLVHGIFGGHDAALRLAEPDVLAGYRRVAPSPVRVPRHTDAGTALRGPSSGHARRPARQARPRPRRRPSRVGGHNLRA